VSTGRGVVHCFHLRIYLISKPIVISLIQLRISPDKESSLSEVRFWHEGELLGIQKVKNSELNLLHFCFLNSPFLKFN